MEELKGLVEEQDDDYTAYSSASRLTLVKEINRRSEESSDYRKMPEFKVSYEVIQIRMHAGHGSGPCVQYVGD